MPVFSGSTSTSATSTAYAIPSEIKSFSVTNISGGVVTLNVSIIYGSTNILISPYNYSLASDGIYEDSKGIKLLADHQIYILVDGSCDYYFSIE